LRKGPYSSNRGGNYQQKILILIYGRKNRSIFLPEKKEEGKNARRPRRLFLLTIVWGRGKRENALIET